MNIRSYTFPQREAIPASGWWRAEDGLETGSATDPAGSDQDPPEDAPACDAGRVLRAAQVATGLTVGAAVGLYAGAQVGWPGIVAGAVALGAAGSAGGFMMGGLADYAACRLHRETHFTPLGTILGGVMGASVGAVLGAAVTPGAPGLSLALGGIGALGGVLWTALLAR